MMREVIQRRFAKHQDVDNKWAELPDLVLIDGGKGHLQASLHAMSEADVENLSVISLAKENEDIYKPNRSEPILLDKSSRELHLLQRIRDESHRFAITYHRQLRSKKSKESVLDTIPGIGQVKKKALIRRFGSVKNIREATIEDIAAVQGITLPLAQTIFDRISQ